jgi:hypothetical protein
MVFFAERAPENKKAPEGASRSTRAQRELT